MAASAATIASWDALIIRRLVRMAWRLSACWARASGRSWRDMAGGILPARREGVGGEIRAEIPCPGEESSVLMRCATRRLSTNRHQHGALAVRVRHHEEVVVVAAPLDDLHLREDLPVEHPEVLEAKRPADRRWLPAARTRARRHQLAVLVDPAGRSHACGFSHGGRLYGRAFGNSSRAPAGLLDRGV